MEGKALISADSEAGKRPALTTDLVQLIDDFCWAPG